MLGKVVGVRARVVEALEALEEEWMDEERVEGGSL